MRQGAELYVCKWTRGDVGLKWKKKSIYIYIMGQRIYKIRSLCTIIYLKSNSPSFKKKKSDSLHCSCSKRILNLNTFISNKYHNSLMKITQVEYSNDHS